MNADPRVVEWVLRRHLSHSTPDPDFEHPYRVSCLCIGHPTFETLGEHLVHVAEEVARALNDRYIVERVLAGENP